MHMLRLSKVLLILFLSLSTAFAEDEIDIIPDSSKEAIALQNDNFRKTARRLRELENGISLTSGVTDILPSENGGTGADLSPCTKGSIPFFTSTGIMACLAPGTSGYFLRSNGAGADPSYAVVASAKILNLSASNVSIASGSSTTSSSITLDSSGDWTGKKFNFIGEICLGSIGDCTIASPNSGPTHTSRNFYSGSASTFVGPFLYTQVNDVSGAPYASRSFISYDTFPSLEVSFGNGLSGGISCSLSVSGGNLMLNVNRGSSSDSVNVNPYCEVSGIITREP